MLATDARHAGPARRLAIGGVAVEGLSMQIAKRRLGKIAEPYSTGLPGKLEKATMATSGAGALAMLAGGLPGRRSPSKAGALGVLAGAVLGRWMVFKAGFQSAAAPHYTLEPQRERATRAR